MPPPYDLLERMRRSKANWHSRDLERLYVGFGFEREQGGRHTLFIHPRWPELRATVTRSDPPPLGYFVTAVRLVDQLLAKEQENA